jgi:sulfide:quinone oxidoreductase
MDKKYIDNMLSKMDKDLSAHGMSRRDAMKMAGLSGAGIFMGTTTSASAEEEKIVKSDAKAKIVIVGGGLAGISTAARLTLNLTDPDITIIEPEKTSASYQPGQTLVAAGIWDEDEIVYQRDDFVPDGVKVIEDRAVFYNPQENKLTTEKGQVVTYDYLILALQLGFNLTLRESKV